MSGQSQFRLLGQRRFGSFFFLIIGKLLPPEQVTAVSLEAQVKALRGALV